MALTSGRTRIAALPDTFSLRPTRLFVSTDGGFRHGKAGVGIIIWREVRPDVLGQPIWEEVASISRYLGTGVSSTMAEVRAMQEAVDLVRAIVTCMPPHWDMDREEVRVTLRLSRALEQDSCGFSPEIATE